MCYTFSWAQLSGSAAGLSQDGSLHSCQRIYVWSEHSLPSWHMSSIQHGTVNSNHHMAQEVSRTHSSCAHESLCLDPLPISSSPWYPYFVILWICLVYVPHTSKIMQYSSFCFWLISLSITALPIKIHLVRVMVFPVVMYGCESWTIKKAGPWRIDAFELWCWRRLLRVPWTARRSHQSILEEISPRCSLEGLMLKLKLQYFGHLIRRTDSFEKTLMLGKIEGGKRRGWQRMRWLDRITDSMGMSEQALGVGDGQGGLACCSPWGCKEWDTTEWLSGT